MGNFTKARKDLAQADADPASQHFRISGTDCARPSLLANPSRRGYDLPHLIAQEKP